MADNRNSLCHDVDMQFILMKDCNKEWVAKEMLAYYHCTEDN